MREINGLVPMLVDESLELEVKVEILESPKATAYDMPTVIVLDKRFEGMVRVLTVNVTRTKVRAHLSVEGRSPVEREFDGHEVLNGTL